MTFAYGALLRAHLGIGIAYRARLTVWILSSLFPLLMMAVWLAVVDEVGPAAGWDTSDFVSYYAAAALLYHTTSSYLIWAWDRDLRTGDLSFKLLKPIDPFHQYLAQEVGFRAVVLVVLLPVLVGVTLLLPDLTYSPSLLQWLAAVISVAAGFFLNVLMSLAFATIGFWTTQAGNLYALWWGVGAFLSGWIAPLPLLPEPVARAAVVLPFRSSMGLPLEIVLERLTTAEIGWGLAITAGWMAVFAMLYRLGWRRGLRRYQAVGG
jgi:ABC-2 type transport system permease protein